MVGPISSAASEGRLQSAREMLARRMEELRRESEDAAEPKSVGVQFRPIENPRVIQARVVDRVSEEVLREVPTTERLRFARRFRETAAEFVGRRLDVEA